MPDRNACDLNTLEQINSKVVESSPDAKVIIDCDGKLVVFNQRAELMFGWGREEVLGKPVEMLIPEDLKTAHEKHRESYLTDPRIRDMGEGRTVYGLHRTGKKFLIQIRLAPLIITGAGVYVLGVIRRLAVGPVVIGIPPPGLVAAAAAAAALWKQVIEDATEAAKCAALAAKAGAVTTETIHDAH